MITHNILSVTKLKDSSLMIRHSGLFSEEEKKKRKRSAPDYDHPFPEQSPLGDCQL